MDDLSVITSPASRLEVSASVPVVLFKGLLTAKGPRTCGEPAFYGNLTSTIASSTAKIGNKTDARITKVTPSCCKSVIAMTCHMRVVSKALSESSGEPSRNLEYFASLIRFRPVMLRS